MKAFCAAPGGCCLKPAAIKGYCGSHYQRHRRGMAMEEPIRHRSAYGRPCETFGCSRRAVARGLCGTCYQRRARNCTTQLPPPSKRVKLVRLADLHVTPQSAERLRQKATELGCSLSAAGRLVLQAWADGLVDAERK